MVSGAIPDPVLLPSPDEPVPVLLMNTVWADRTDVHDVLDVDSGLDRWLDAVGHRLGADLDLSGTSVHQQELDQFRELRNALRTLAAATTADSRDRARDATPEMTAAAAVEALNRAGAAAPPIATLTLPAWESTSVAPPHTRPRVAALSRVAAEAVELLGGPDRALLRACYAPGCVLYFVKDHPRREWCSAACGNRARAARHYRRHRAAGRP